MAEIVLITGTPGAGKTAHMVHMMLHDPIFKTPDGELRKVFTNIKGLELPHIAVSSLKEELAHSTDEQLSFHDMHTWIKKPENHGSVVIIDEVQDVWPARSNGSQVPPNVSWLNTHRHLGVDIFVLTQNPKNIDINLRGLVNKHLHIAKNKLGMRTLLEWKYCANNPLTQAKDAFAKIHKLDDKVFDLYKSAEIHTENKTKVTKWVFVLPVVFILMPIMIYFSYSLLKNIGKTEETATETTTASAPATLNGSNATQSLTGALPQNQMQNTLGAKPEDFIARLAERPETKPLYDGQRQVKTMEWPEACVIGVDKKCTCYTNQFTKIKEISQELCESYLEDGMPFNPYKSPEQETQPQQTQTTETEPMHDQAYVAQLNGETRPSLNEGNAQNLANIQ
ncbi:zonular occludens toxin family protein [Neisseriaceae bacterium B1]